MCPLSTFFVPKKEEGEGPKSSQCKLSEKMENYVYKYGQKTNCNCRLQWVKVEQTIVPDYKW